MLIFWGGNSCAVNIATLWLPEKNLCVLVFIGMSKGHVAPSDFFCSIKHNLSQDLSKWHNLSQDLSKWRVWMFQQFLVGWFQPIWKKWLSIGSYPQVEWPYQDLWKSGNSYWKPTIFRGKLLVFRECVTCITSKKWPYKSIKIVFTQVISCYFILYLIVAGPHITISPYLNLVFRGGGHLQDVSPWFWTPPHLDANCQGESPVLGVGCFREVMGWWRNGTITEPRCAWWDRMKRCRKL